MADPGDEMIAIASSSKPTQPVVSSSSTPDAQEDLLDDGDERLRRICDEYDKRIYGLLQADGFTASNFWVNTFGSTYFLLSESIQKVLKDKTKVLDLVSKIDFKLSLDYERVISRVAQTMTRDVQLEEWLVEKLKHRPRDEILQRCLLGLNSKREAHGENAMASLKRTYVGNAHETMYEELCGLSSGAKSGFHYSCYTAIVQSSGTGKTRGVLEMSRLGVYVCYCSTAAATGTACPPRSGQLADELSETCNEVDMALYFKAWLSVLVDKAVDDTMSPQVWLDSQIGDTIPVKNSQLVDTCTIRNLVLQRWREYRDVVDLERRSQENCDQRNLRLLQPELDKLRQGLPAARGSLKILLVFDEAQGLLPGGIQASSEALVCSPFYQMRRVSRAFFTHKFCFSVCMDTTARITGMHPSSSEEHSRKATGLGKKLLPPVYQVLNLQLVTPSADLSPEKLFRIGRPLWSSRLDWGEDLESFLTFVERKLICVPYVNLEGEPAGVFEKVVMGESQAISLLSVTVGLQISALSVVGLSLVASHMGIVTFISLDGSRVHVAHAVEPAVSEAAARILNRDGGKPFLAALKKLNQAFFSVQGEFVCKTLFLMAGWRLYEGLYLRPIPVREYLVSLLGLSKEEVNRACDGLPEASYVLFNSFMLMNERERVTEEILGGAYLRACGIHFKAGNQVKAVDFYVPVSTSKGMTCIAVSAKSYQCGGKMRKQGTEEVNPRNLNLRVSKGLKVLTLLINVTEPKERLPAAMLWDPGQLSLSYRETFNPEQVAHMSLFGLKRNFRGFKLNSDGTVKREVDLTDVEREARRLLLQLLMAAPDDAEREAGLVSARAADYVRKLGPYVYRADLEQLARLAGAQPPNSSEDDTKVEDGPGGVKRRRWYI